MINIDTLKPEYIPSVAQIERDCFSMPWSEDAFFEEIENPLATYFVATEGKNGYYYCVTLKKRGQSFEYDMKERKRNFGLLILRSMFLATVSFVFGLILRAIFKR